MEGQRELLKMESSSLDKQNITKWLEQVDQDVIFEKRKESLDLCTAIDSALSSHIYFMYKNDPESIMARQVCSVANVVKNKIMGENMFTKEDVGKFLYRAEGTNMFICKPFLAKCVKLHSFAAIKSFEDMICLVEENKVKLDHLEIFAEFPVLMEDEDNEEEEEEEEEEAEGWAEQCKSFEVMRDDCGAANPVEPMEGFEGHAYCGVNEDGEELFYQIEDADHDTQHHDLEIKDLFQCVGNVLNKLPHLKTLRFVITSGNYAGKTFMKWLSSTEFKLSMLKTLHLNLNEVDYDKVARNVTDFFTKLGTNTIERFVLKSGEAEIKLSKKLFLNLRDLELEVKEPASLQNIKDLKVPFLLTRLALSFTTIKTADFDVVQAIVQRCEDTLLFLSFKLNPLYLANINQEMVNDMLEVEPLAAPKLKALEMINGLPITHLWISQLSSLKKLHFWQDERVSSHLQTNVSDDDGFSQFLPLRDSEDVERLKCSPKIWDRFQCLEVITLLVSNTTENEWDEAKEIKVARPKN